MMILALTYLIGTMLCLLLSAYFSGIETAAISANRARLQHLELTGDERAREILRLLANIQYVIGVVLVGTNIFNVLGALAGRKFLIQLFPDLANLPLWGRITIIEVIALLSLTILFLVFAEILPKQIFRHKADKLLLILGLPLKFFALLFHPILKVLNFIVFSFLSLTGISPTATSPSFTKEDLMMLLGTSPAEKKFDERSLERRMIRKVFALEKTLTREVMHPINDVVALRIGQETIKSVLQLARKTGYSRFPVFRDRVTELIGYIDIYQILRSDIIDKRLEDFLKPAYYVPETKSLDNLLEQLLRRGEHVAIVVDEFGACSGLITLEDVLEEIVGEIEDEFHRTSVDIIKEDEFTFVTEAKVDIDDLNERLGVNLPKVGYETLGGLIYRGLGEIPKVGAVLKIDNIELSVLSMTGHRIDRIRLRIMPTEAPDS